MICFVIRVSEQVEEWDESERGEQLVQQQHLMVESVSICLKVALQGHILAVILYNVPIKNTRYICKYATKSRQPHPQLPRLSFRHVWYFLMMFPGSDQQMTWRQWHDIQEREA